jgi:hypothetical protein
LFISDAVTEISLYGRIKQRFTKYGQDERRGKSEQARINSDQSNAKGKGENARQHTEPAPALIGKRSKDGAKDTRYISAGQREGDGRHIHTETMGKDGQERIDHPVHGIQDNAQKGNGDDLDLQFHGTTLSIVKSGVSIEKLLPESCLDGFYQE